MSDGVGDTGAAAVKDAWGWGGRNKWARCGAQPQHWGRGFILTDRQGAFTDRWLRSRQRVRLGAARHIEAQGTWGEEATAIGDLASRLAALLCSARRSSMCASRASPIGPCLAAESIAAFH